MSSSSSPVWLPRSLRRVVWVLAGLQMVASAPAIARDSPGQAIRSRGPANIIFILADDLGYGDLGCYGSRAIATPHLDRLAREGIRFTQAYAGSPVCAPSRNVLLTGRHSGHTRIRDNSPQTGGELEQFAGGREGGHRLSLLGSDHTIAQLLQSRGYATGIAGKWGLAEPGTAGTPNRLGFDEWLGYLNQNHAAYHYPEYLDENEGVRRLLENSGDRHGAYSNDLFADFALDFIRRHTDRPFFLYLPFTVPHNLIQVPALGDYAARDWPADARIYAAMVTRLDSYVGRLLAELDRLGLAQDTILFFTSDNGPLPAPRSDHLNSAGGLRGRKSSLYEGGLRVPFIVRWPGRVRAGQVSAEPCMFADVFPTLAELAGASLPAGLDGQSLLPLLGGSGSLPTERPFYWEFPRERLHQAARLGRWKAVRFGTDQPIELYDLTADPAETTDVAAQHPSVVARLRAILDTSHQPSPHWPVH